jgi:hypothetical protein
MKPEKQFIYLRFNSSAYSPSPPTSHAAPHAQQFRLDCGDVVNFQAGENLAVTDGVRTLAVATLVRTGSLRGRAMPIRTHVGIAVRWPRVVAACRGIRIVAWWFVE